VSCLKSFCIGQ